MVSPFTFDEKVMVDDKNKKYKHFMKRKIIVKYILAVLERKFAENFDGKIICFQFFEPENFFL